MSEDVQHVPRCTVYGQASLSESDYTHTPHADMIWSWCQTKGTLIVHILVGVYTASVLSANSHRNPRWCIPLPVSCNWWGGIPLHGCQMVSRDLETAEDIGRSCWWGTPSTSDICARGVKQRVAMESHHWHGSRLTSWLYNEKIWKVHTQNSCSRWSSRISPPWKWMYPQVSVLTLKGVVGGGNGASSQTTCWELTQLDPQFVKVTSKNDGYLQKGHDELTDHERFGVYRKETFQRGYWFDCIAIICNNKLQLSCLKLGGSILGWFKHMSWVICLL